MIKAIVSDFSFVLLFPKDQNFKESINGFHRQHHEEPQYNAFDYFELNIELLNFYQSLKDKTSLYIFTTDIVQDAPEFQPFLQPVFKDIFSARKMNTDKKNPEAYKMISDNVNLKPEEILFIDDTTANIEAAKTAGLNTILYVGNEDLFLKINSLLAS